MERSFLIARWQSKLFFFFLDLSPSANHHFKFSKLVQFISELDAESNDLLLTRGLKAQAFCDSLDYSDNCVKRCVDSTFRTVTPSAVSV